MGCRGNRWAIGLDSKRRSLAGLSAQTHIACMYCCPFSCQATGTRRRCRLLLHPAPAARRSWQMGGATCACAHHRATLT